jgi:hypothetical protein
MAMTLAIPLFDESQLGIAKHFLFARLQQIGFSVIFPLEKGLQFGVAIVKPLHFGGGGDGVDVGRGGR